MTQTKPVEDTVATDSFNYYKRNAGYRNLPWELSREDVKRLIFEPCFYCGIVGDTIAKARHKSANGPERITAINGIDRFDNELGYTVENAVPCCTKCNHGKHDLSFDAFREWANKLVAHFAKKGDQ
jgi:5-methylcytosine-specific restriction endonuclease McrA